MKISPNKSLGQHFLVNAGVVKKICDVVQSLAERGPTGPRAPVIEIGPGPGALTEALLERGLRVLAVEIDSRMIEQLETRFKSAVSSGQLRLLRADVLKLDLEKLFADSEILDGTVCGNLPYNVGTQIVMKLIEEAPAARSFCFMLQKEVVERFIASEGGAEYGIPSVKLAWTSRLLGHFWVKPGSFDPPPKVDSGVFWYRRLSSAEEGKNSLERKGDYDRASAYVSKLFQHRRKMIRATDKRLSQHALGKCRPQELSPKQLFELALSLTGEATDE